MNRIRKMQTAAGGPIKRLKDGYRYIPDSSYKQGWARITDDLMSDLFAKLEVTPNKNRSGSDISRKQQPKTSNYRSAYNPDDIIKGFNILTLGGLNNLSPTQWARRIYDTGKLATGNMTWSGYTDSWINGNNGLVSQKFSEEHPYLSAGANIIGDTLPIALATTPLNAINKVELIGKITVPGFIGGVGGIYVGDKLDEYLPKKYKNLGKSIGYGVGAALGVKLGLSKGINNLLLLRTKYTKLNDVVNNPLTTTAATIQGKYPWTRRQDIRLKRLLFDDIEEAKIWLNNSGYDRMYLPEVRILKKDLYYPDAIGKYSPYYNKVTVLPTFNKYSNLPLETNSNKLMTFKGVVNHELTHGRLNYFGSYSEYDPESGYWIARKDLDMESLNPFKLKKNGSWSASPDEFDSELSNLLITTGKSAFEPVDDISPLTRRLSISKQAARNFEKDILNNRKSLEFFKLGGMLQFLQKGKPIKVPKKRTVIKTIKLNNGVLTAELDKDKNVYWFRNNKYLTPDLVKNYKFYDPEIKGYRLLSNYYSDLIDPKINGTRVLEFYNKGKNETMKKGGIIKAQTGVEVPNPNATGGVYRDYINYLLNWLPKILELLRLLKLMDKLLEILKSQLTSDIVLSLIGTASDYITNNLGGLSKIFSKKSTTDNGAPSTTSMYKLSNFWSNPSIANSLT